MQELEVTVAAAGTLVVRGDVDAASASAIDLRDCSFMDSTGISVLVEAKALAEARTAEFRLVEPSEAVARLLEVCEMSAVFGLP